MTNMRFPFASFLDDKQAFFTLASPANIALQGMTRSGKSSSAYHLISELSALPTRFHCIDPSSVLGKPLEAAGLADRSYCAGEPAGKAVAVVEHLLELVRHRCAALWPNRIDKVTEFNSSYPLHVLILEELPSMVEFLQYDDASNGRKPAERLAHRFMSSIHQILAQGLKVGVMVIALAQRFDVSIITGPARNNFAVRACLRVDDSAAVEMLIPGSAGKDLLDKAATFEPGECLLTTPKRRASRASLYHCDYQEFLQRLGV